MPVIKSKIQTNYFIYPNSVAQSALSLEAKGLIAYMSSKPDDWIFHKEVIQKECSIGRDRLVRVFKELESNGHLASTQHHGKDGKFLRSEMVFFVEPSNNPAFMPFTEKPSTGEPLTVNPKLQSKDINKVKINTNIREFFDVFWDGYPKKADKKKAEVKFKTIVKSLKIKDDDLLDFSNFLVKDCSRRFANTEKQFIPLATTYLNGERWNDEL